MSFSWLASPQLAVPILERVGLNVEARCLASQLDPWDRTRLTVARALRGNPDRLIVAEPEDHLGPDDVVRLLRLLRRLASRDRLPILVSLADAALLREVDTVLTIVGGEAESVVPGVEPASVSTA